MLPRSLSNFMNAFTSSDHTSYPFATTNRKDFQNLMSVYLDATLHPLLNEHDFIQEGWRIGPENPVGITDAPNGSNSHGDLVFKGVVYNEMKGQMSDASYLYYIRFQDLIFPDINNSGGDPRKMTDLTYEDLKDFHASNYHPSNAKIFTYGNFPFVNHLQEIDRKLKRFKKAQAEETIKVPISLDAGPIHRTVKGPTDPMVDKDMQYKTSTSWITGNTSNVLETFSLGVLSSLLIDGFGSPMYQALIEAGLAPDWSPNTGFDSSGKVGIFSIGLSGVRKEDVAKVQQIIKAKISEIHQKGFDKHKVDGILHQLELSLKHKTANFGMGLMQRIQPGWFNGVDPFDSLAWDDIVTAFKNRFAEGRYLESLLERYLLNDRTFTFTMEPSESYATDLVSEEAARLAGNIKELSEKLGGKAKAYDQLTTQELKLLESQSSANSQDVSCLPSVHVSDIPRQAEKKSTRNSLLRGVDIQWRKASTNGLTYFRAINTLIGLPTELRVLIPLFSDAIMRLGTKTKTMEELEDLIKLKTGGLSMSYHASPSPMDMKSCNEGLCVSGYAFDSNISAMYELLRTLIQETNFDGPEAEGRLRQLLQADANGALDAVASSGHSYARRFAEAGLTHYGLLTEQTGGLTQIQQTADLANRPSVKGLQDIIRKLKEIQQHVIVNGSSFRAALTCEPASVSPNQRALENFLSNFPDNTRSLGPGEPTIPARKGQKTFFPLPYQVSYTAVALPTEAYVHPSGAPLQVLSQLLTHKHLHHEIREKGGAYGGGAYSRGLSGLFGYYSYRDPNPENTLRTILDAGRWARDKQWTDQDLEEAKLSVFQNVDAPESVSQEGMTRFLSGIDEEMEQKKREQMLDVTKQDVQDVAHKYLVEGMKNATTAMLGKDQAFIKEQVGWDTRNIELSKPSEIVGASDFSAGNSTNISA